MFLALETLISIIRTGLPILLEVIDLVNSVIIFIRSSQMNLLRWLTLLLRSQIGLDSFISFDAIICSTINFPLLGSFNHVVSQFSLTFHQIHIGMPHFIA